MGVTAAHSDSLEGCAKRIFAHRDFPSGCGRKNLLSGKLPKRRISAIRNFPPGCGRKACLFMAKMNPSAETVRDDVKQVREKVLDEDPSSIGLKENIVRGLADKVEVESVGDVGKVEQVQVRTPSGGNLELEDPQQTSVRLDWKSNLYQPSIKNIEGNVSSLKGKLAKESVERCKKIAFPGESGDKNDAFSKCTREKSIGLASSGKKVPWHPSMAALNRARIHGEHSPRSNLGSNSSRDNVKKHELKVKKTALDPSDNRVIVQALMAAPNCPWRQGRRKIKRT
ncbi:uncharacterized protein LOC122085543 [Macadamia integrifolia]|uniref:uncharacterized protein LOC122085543 n=1 Tax=Macadamia integrifolia TaxID=60698 RepID=UPI001C4F0DBA|nr:uncharacterized protein LOC122085543 [Macadamia integrifolia]XP_042509952.1 uncharacterized protein LOC122085543 [Macadamia integrifolia]